MFDYDKDNNLLPYDIIPTSENDFRRHFIDELDDATLIRSNRWVEYCRFISFIKSHTYIRKGFKVWIYGSLVGKYKVPSDIDVVCFFDKLDFKCIQSSFLDAYIKANSKQIFNVHCDYIFIHPETEQDVAELNKFKDMQITRNSTKGAIEINYLS